MACAALCAAGARASTAHAQAPPIYTLEIVEGETTLPEYAVAHTAGSVRSKSSVTVQIVRAGTVIAQSSGEGGAWMSQVPQVGDVVSLQSPTGNTVGSFVYDGLPSIDPTVCVGSTNFSGQNSPGQTVKGFYFTETPHNPYSPERTNSGRAQVTILSGTSFGGSFLSPLQSGQTVAALESLETPLAGGAVFDYQSETVRPVGSCPPPPPPPPPPALQGSVLKLLHGTILSLLKSGWLDKVTINQPGTVTQDLYLDNGKLPAYAASSKRHKTQPPALLLARGAVTVSTAGTVTVKLKLTARGRSKLKAVKNVKVVLITTLHSTSGAKLNLERRTVSLHR